MNPPICRHSSRLLLTRLRRIERNRRCLPVRIGISSDSAALIGRPTSSRLKKRATADLPSSESLTGSGNTGRQAARATRNQLAIRFSTGGCETVLATLAMSRPPPRCRSHCLPTSRQSRRILAAEVEAFARKHRCRPCRIVNLFVRRSGQFFKFLRIDLHERQRPPFAQGDELVADFDLRAASEERPGDFFHQSVCR